MKEEFIISSKKEARIIIITPEMAKYWIENYSKGELKPSKTIVRLMASQMRSGKWISTPDPICFSSDKRLINGRVRLKASVLSNVSFRALIVTGVDPFETMDIISRKEKRDERRPRNR